MNLFMAAAAPSPLASSVEKTNGAKLSRLLIDGGTTVLRKIFDGHHPPANLITDVNANYSILNNLLRRRVLNGHQWDKLFPPCGVTPDSNTFDITLLFLLLTNICGLTPPPSGWHTKPPSSDTSHEANLARVKFYRNILYGHVTTTGFDTPTFSALWTEISGVLVNLGLDQAEVDRLKAEKGGEQDYIDVLYEWADSEEDIKSQLNNLHKSQGQTHQAVEDVRQAQVKTQQSVDEVCQKVKEVEAGLKEIKERAEKDGKDKDRSEEVLRNLTKSEFRGLSHLSHALPEYKQALVEQLSRNLGTDLTHMGVEELFALLFKEPLSTLGDPGRDMLMVIDGLDESEYRGRNELLDVIANQFCKLPIWIRFVVTTRPALNITDKLKHLKPLELKSNAEENLEDVRVFCLKRLEHIVKTANVAEFVKRLVLKSEGLMLYAHFLILSITENASIVQEGNLVDSLPSGISSVYHSYFKRLERELLKELDVNEEHFLNLLSTMTASREPLPVGFVSKVLMPSINSPLTRRKVLRALTSVSSLLPVRDDCLHVIHKSVKDWLTDSSCYVEHEFIMDENEGHRILAALCTDELDILKRKSVHNIQFSATERYALSHGAHHMLHKGVKREPHKLDELIKAYIIDVDIVYAKTCFNSTTAAEDLLWLKKKEIFTLLSKDNQSVVDTLLFLLRKNLRLLMDTPRTFLQTILNQGGKVLTFEASNLLRNKYPEIAYLEDVHNETQQGGVVARFECLSVVVCLDVSPQLDYMVCECEDGMLRLWSLQTGRLVWTRPVIVEKSFKTPWFLGYARKLPSVHVSLFRSVAFHPTKECILPGILSQAYSTMNGDLKPLFPGSNCRFSVCSISGDKTMILTNCLESSKCLVLWSLENGSEVDRILEDEDILSFAWTSDGRLLAISHSSGVISLVDVMCGFRKLAHTATPEVYGAVRFSPDHRFLLCRRAEDAFCLKVVRDTPSTFSLTVCHDIPYDLSHALKNFNSFNDCGFLFGDPVTTDGSFYPLTFFLDDQRLLQYYLCTIEMVDTKGLNKSSQGESTQVTGIEVSLDGQTVYVASEKSVIARDMFNGKFKEINRLVTLQDFCPLCPVSGGVLISTNPYTLKFWNYDLSKCIETWPSPSGIEQLILVSKERVAVVGERVVMILDTSTREFVQTILSFGRRILTCNSKCQLLTITDSHSLQLLLSHTPQFWYGPTVVWEKRGIDMGCYKQDVAFSPMEQFLIVGTMRGVLVLDAETGIKLRTLPSLSRSSSLTFISDDQCVITGSDLTVQVFNVNLFNVRSGELLSTIDVESKVTCLAACPLNRILAIGLKNSTPNVKLLRVFLPRSKDGESGKR